MNWSAGTLMPARNEEAVNTTQENGAVATQPSSTRVVNAGAGESP